MLAGERLVRGDDMFGVFSGKESSLVMPPTITIASVSKTIIECPLSARY